MLYVTNGETTDFAHLRAGTLAWTPELEEGCAGCGFVFPDDEALVQAEFEKVLPFAQDVVASAARPGEPGRRTSGSTTKPFYLESDDTYKAGLPLANFTFAVSYGDPQDGAGAGAPRASARSTSSTASTAARSSRRDTDEWNGGERYGGKTDVYYHVMRRVR